VLPQVDLECADWLAAHEVPFAIVFTKTDAKKKDSKGSTVNIRNFKLELLKEWEAVPPCFETSSKTGIGRSEVLAYISGLKQLHESDS
jgi:GTP-binding protein